MIRKQNIAILFCIINENWIRKKNKFRGTDLSIGDSIRILVYNILIIHTTTTPV